MGDAENERVRFLSQIDAANVVTRRGNGSLNERKRRLAIDRSGDSPSDRRGTTVVRIVFAEKVSHGNRESIGMYVE